MTAIPDVDFPLPPGVDPAAIAGLVITADGSATALLSDGREIALDLFQSCAVFRLLLARRLEGAVLETLGVQ